MTDGPHIVAICGSLRERSHTRVAATQALAGADRRGGTTELVDLREFDLPVFDADDDTAGDADRLTAAVRSADAIILGTPMYHGSYSSPLKTALDYCGFDEFESKTVGLLAVSGGSFPIPALEHLRGVCRALDAWVIPYQAAIPNAHRHVDGDAIVDDSMRERVTRLGERAVQFANIEPDPASFESGENVGATD